jgi:uncharacterized membrane protein
MKQSSLVLATLAAGGLMVATTSQAKPSWAKKGVQMEKCAGIAKKGKNDCGANGHGCSGQAAKDNDPNEWIYMPKGLCEKVAGGKVVKKK